MANAFQPHNWQKFTLSFVPTGNTVQVSVGQFGPKSTVEIYFDNVQLVASPNTATPAPQFTPTETSTSSGSETPTSTSTLTESPTPTPTLPVAPVGKLSQAKYIYDGDGNLVKSEVTSLVNDVPSVTITYYASSHYNEQNTDNGVDKIQKTYNFGGQTVAVRTIQGQPKLVDLGISDNLNSTAVTANSDGSFNSEIRYSAFGEIRSSSGTTPTNYKYTGQLKSTWVGPGLLCGTLVRPLYYPILPDLIRLYPICIIHILDRYAYVRYNPINFTDLSGNKAWQKQENDSGQCDQVTNNDLEDIIKWTFGWTTEGDFTKKDLEKIIDAGNKISDKVTSITNKWGTGWIRSNLGNAVLEQNGWSNWFTTNVVGRPAVTLANTILLQTGSWDVYTLIHELGHVLDHNTQIPGSAGGPADIWGGAADKMEGMGGNSAFCVPRFLVQVIPTRGSPAVILGPIVLMEVRALQKILLRLL